VRNWNPWRNVLKNWKAGWLKGKESKNEDL